MVGTRVPEERLIRIGALLLLRRPGSQALIVRLLAAAGAMLVLLLMMVPTFSAKFGLIDDHKIIGALPKSGALPLPDVPGRVISQTDEGIGRVRPGYWLGQALEEALVGHNVTWWYVDRFLLAALVLLLVFLVASRFIGPAPSAAVSLLPFSGPQFETWTRLGPNEAYALPAAVAGLAIVILAAARGRTRPAQLIVGYLFLIFAGLCKENFAVLAPAVVFTQVLVSASRQSFRKVDWVTAGVVVLISGLNLAAVAYQVARYGTVYPQTRGPEAVRGKLLEIFGVGDQFAGLTLGLIALAVLALMAHPASSAGLPLRRAGLILASVLVLFVLPQAVLLGGTVAQGRYLYPAVLFFPVVWTVAFAVAAMPRSATAGIAGTALLLLLLALPFRAGFHQARTLAAVNAATTQQFQAKLQDISAAARRAGVQVIVMQPADAVRNYEPAVSFAIYLRQQHGFTIMVIPVPSPEGPYAESLNDDLRQWSQRGSVNFRPYEPGGCFSLVWGSNTPVCQSATRMR